MRRTLLKILSAIAATMVMAGCSALPSLDGTSGEQTVRVDFPTVTNNIGSRSLLECVSLVDTDITGSNNPALTDGIEGKVVLGREGVRLFMDDSTLVFLSEAAADTGDLDGMKFTILANDSLQIVAYFYNGTSMNSFVLNKRNGLAIWSKIRPTFPVYDAPTGGVSYLQCGSVASARDRCSERRGRPAGVPRG